MNSVKHTFVALVTLMICGAVQAQASKNCGETGFSLLSAPEGTICGTPEGGSFQKVLVDGRPGIRDLLPGGVTWTGYAENVCATERAYTPHAIATNQNYCDGAAYEFCVEKGLDLPTAAEMMRVHHLGFLKAHTAFKQRNVNLWTRTLAPKTKKEAMVYFSGYGGMIRVALGRKDNSWERNQPRANAQPELEVYSATCVQRN